MKTLISLFIVTSCLNLVAQTHIGGTIYYRLPNAPSTLHPTRSTDAYSSRIHSYTFDGLLTVNINTYEFEPGLAKEWTLSKDGRTFTFTLREDAQWHDGKPVTAEDVKFSFDIIFDPKQKSLHLQSYFDNIEGAQILGKNKIQFKAKKKYFKNLDILGSGGFLPIIPKHIYSTKKKMNKDIVGSGPYKLTKYQKGRQIELTKNKKWWGFKEEHLKGQYNFEKIIMRIVKDNNVSLEYLKKGRIDFQPLSSEEYHKKTKGKMWQTEVIKNRVQNLSPKGYGFIGWNLQRKIFQNKKVRVALAHLMNRRLMNKKFRFGESLLATGPWHRKSDYADKSVKAIEYNPKKALKLLKQTGWNDTDKDGILEKNIQNKKQNFEITILCPNKEVLKYLTLFKEDAKKVGVKINIKSVEWNTFLKLIDDSRFDGAMLAWGGGSIDLDPKQIWHSDGARSGGSNFIHYKNPEVDKLIIEAQETLDKKKRIKILQKVYRIIANDAPYLFLFNDEYTFYAHRQRVKKDKGTFKYGIGFNYWWLEK